MIDALGNELISEAYRINSLRVRLIKLESSMLSADALRAGDGRAPLVHRGARSAATRPRWRAGCPTTSRARTGACSACRGRPCRRAPPWSADLPAPTPLPGIWPALLTPLDAALNIDHATFAAHARALIAAGCGGVTPFGTTGEGPSFGLDERRAAIDALVEGGVPGRQILVSTSCAALPETLALTQPRAAGRRVGLPDAAAVLPQGGQRRGHRRRVPRRHRRRGRCAAAHHAVPHPPGRRRRPVARA